VATCLVSGRSGAERLHVVSGMLDWGDDAGVERAPGDRRRGRERQLRARPPDGTAASLAQNRNAGATRTVAITRALRIFCTVCTFHMASPSDTHELGK
jgi:hypothetical protein